MTNLAALRLVPSAHYVTATLKYSAFSPSLHLPLFLFLVHGCRALGVFVLSSLRILFRQVGLICVMNVSYPLVHDPG